MVLHKPQFGLRGGFAKTALGFNGYFSNDTLPELSGRMISLHLLTEVRKPSRPEIAVRVEHYCLKDTSRSLCVGIPRMSYLPLDASYPDLFVLQAMMERFMGTAEIEQALQIVILDDPGKDMSEIFACEHASTHCLDRQQEAPGLTGVSLLRCGAGL